MATDSLSENQSKQNQDAEYDELGSIDGNACTHLVRFCHAPKKVEQGRKNAVEKLIDLGVLGIEPVFVREQFRIKKKC